MALAEIPIILAMKSAHLKDNAIHIYFRNKFLKEKKIGLVLRQHFSKKPTVIIIVRLHPANIPCGNLKGHFNSFLSPIVRILLAVR